MPLDGPGGNRRGRSAAAVRRYYPAQPAEGELAAAGGDDAWRWALFVVLLPTVLIGVCAKPDMVCRALMKPMLTLAGILVVALGALCFLLAGRQKE